MFFEKKITIHHSKKLLKLLVFEYFFLSQLICIFPSLSYNTSNLLGVFFNCSLMAFSIDRTEAARRLSVSSRTVDRHISAGRIATKRIGKKTFLEEDDVELLRKTLPERGDDTIVILASEPHDTPEIITRERSVSREKTPDFASLYGDAQKIIAKKDEIIQELSYKLGKSETELKNSIPLIEYKKTTFLLE